MQVTSIWFGRERGFSRNKLFWLAGPGPALGHWQIQLELSIPLSGTLYLILQVLPTLQPHEYSVDEVVLTYHEQFTRDCLWHIVNHWCTVSYLSGTTLLR